MTWVFIIFLSLYLSLDAIVSLRIVLAALKCTNLNVWKSALSLVWIVRHVNTAEEEDGKIMISNFCSCERMKHPKQDQEEEGTQKVESLWACNAHTGARMQWQPHSPISKHPRKLERFEDDKKTRRSRQSATASRSKVAFALAATRNATAEVLERRKLSAHFGSQRTGAVA